MKFVRDCIGKLKSSNRGYVAVLLAVLAPVVMAMFYIYIKEFRSNINQTAINLATKEAALAAAGNYYDGEAIAFKTQQQFLDRKATTVFNSLMKMRVGLKNNIIPMKRTSVMYSVGSKQDGVTDFLISCQRSNASDYDPDFEYMKPISIVQQQDWFFYVKYAQRSSAGQKGGTESYYTKDGSAKSDNTLRIEKVDSDRIKVYADVILDTGGHEKRYTAEYTAEAPVCDVDMVIGVPVNKNLGQKAKEISSALRAFVKNWLPVRGCAIGVIPYSGKVGVLTAAPYYDSSKVSGEENQLSIPISDSYNYLGSDGGSLYARNIGRTHNGVTGLMFNFDKFGKDSNLKDRLYELITPNIFTYAPLNVCYGGNVSVATGRCRENTKNYQYPCPMIGLTYDLLSVHKYLGLLNDGFSDSSSFLYLPIMFGMSMLKDGGYTPPLLNGFSGIDHINDDDTKKVAIIIANQADRFEHHELTYFGYNNDASYVSMIEGDRLDFENGNIIYIGSGYLANDHSNNKHAGYYKNARIKTTYNVTDKNHCEKGDVVIPTKQNMRFIVASLPFVRIYRNNGHFDEVEVTNVTSNSIVLTKDEYFQCFIPPGEDTQLNISYSGNKPVLVKMEFFECEARGEPSGHYLRQDADYVYICRKGTSASGSARLGVYQTKKVNNSWWALAYCDNHLLGRASEANDEGRSNSYTDTYRERKSLRNVKVCNARLSSVSAFKYRSQSIIRNIFASGEVCKVDCKEWHSWHGEMTGHDVFCVRPGQRSENHKLIPKAVLPSKYGDDPVFHYSDLKVTFKRTDAVFGSNISYQNEMKKSPSISLLSKPQSSSDSFALLENISGDISYNGNIDIGTIELEPFQQMKGRYSSCRNEHCPYVWNLFCNLGSAEITSSSIKAHYDRTVEVECKNVEYGEQCSHTVVLKSDANVYKSPLSNYSIDLHSCIDETVATARYRADEKVSVTHYVKSLRSETITEMVTRELKMIKAYSYARIYTHNLHSKAVVTSVTATSGGVVVPGSDCFDCYVTSTGGAKFSVHYSEHTDTIPVIARVELYGSEIDSCDKTIMQDSNYVYACGQGGGAGSGSFSISVKPIDDSSEMTQHPPLSYCNNELYRSSSTYYYDVDRSKLKLQNLYNVSVSTKANGTYSGYKCEVAGTRYTGEYDASRDCGDTKLERGRWTCQNVNDEGKSFYLPSDGILRYTALNFFFTLKDRTKDEKGDDIGCIKDPPHCSFRHPLGANVIIDGKTHKFRPDNPCKMGTDDDSCNDGNCQNRKSTHTFSIPSPNKYKGKKVQVKPYLGTGSECMYSHWGNNRYACFGFLRFYARIDYVYDKQKSGGDVEVESKASFGMSKKDSYESTTTSRRSGRVITYTLSSAGNSTSSSVTLDCDSPKSLSHSIEITRYSVKRNVSSVYRRFRELSKGNIQFTSGYSGKRNIYDLEEGYTQVYILKEHLTGTKLSFSVNNVFVSAIEWCNVLTTKNNTYLERVKDATATSLPNRNLPCIGYEEPQRTRHNVGLNMTGGRDVTGIGNLNVPYGSDLSLIFEDRYDAEDRIISLASEKYGYLNGLNRYFRSCLNEKGGINAGLASGGTSPVYLFTAEHTLPVNRILQACYGQKVSNNNVNETPTNIMRNKVAVDACKKFVQTFKKNGRLYIVRYLNPNDKNYNAESAAFDKLKVDSSGVRIYEATNSKELNEAMNDILLDVEKFAGYRGVRIIEGSTGFH